MIASASRVQAAATRTHYVSPHGAHADVETYIGKNKALLGGSPAPAVDALATMPNAYLVCQQPGAQLHPHFHQADQFQVIVGGEGRIGTHAVSALTVHYAAAHSPYGPVVAGGQGLEYLTLRRHFDPGAQWMPEHADQLRAMRERRHVVLTSEPVAMQSGVPAGGDCTVQALLQEGGVQAFVVTLGAVARWQDTARSDLFAYVMQGSAAIHGVELEPQGCLFAGEDDAPLAIAAGPSGARVLVTRFAPARGR